MVYITKVGITITSDRPLAKQEKLQKAEAWIDSALTAGFNLLGTFSKFDVTGVDVEAEASFKDGDGDA